MLSDNERCLQAGAVPTGGAVRTVGRGQRTSWQLAGVGEPLQRQGFWGMATGCREQGCPGTPEDGMVDGGGLGMRLGALCLISCPADAPLTAVSACLSLLPAGPGAPQLCAPAVFLQGLLQTVYNVAT